MRRYGGSGLAVSGIALFVSLFATSCGDGSGITNPSVARTQTSPWSVGSKLSGERFSSNRAKSSCSGSPWTFQVSGKARGPFPGTFTVQGTVSADLTFREKFEIRSGSRSIYGSAYSQASATPSGGCSKSGQLSFDFPILQYRPRHSKSPKMGYAALSGPAFIQGFE